MDKDMQERFYDAFWLIENHPAFLGRKSGVDSIDIRVEKCCVNGYGELNILTVNRGDERFDEFLGRGFQEHLNPEHPEFDDIWLPYEAFYGYPWSFDHIEVWIEGGAQFYSLSEFEPHEWRWDSMHDIDLDSGGRSYEEALISFADLVKEKYGDYSSDESDEKTTIIPKWIIEHNKKNPLFGKDRKEWIKNGIFNTNPKNIRLNDEEINALWWNLNSDVFDLGSRETIDITKYLTKENYESSLNSES